MRKKDGDFSPPGWCGSDAHCLLVIFVIVVEFFLKIIACGLVPLAVGFGHLSNQAISGHAVGVAMVSVVAD